MLKHRCVLNMFYWLTYGLQSFTFTITLLNWKSETENLRTSSGDIDCRLNDYSTQLIKLGFILGFNRCISCSYGKWVPALSVLMSDASVLTWDCTDRSREEHNKNFRKFTNETPDLPPCPIYIPCNLSSAISSDHCLLWLPASGGIFCFCMHIKY